MSTEQPELIPQKANKTSYDFLVRILESNGGWMTAREILSSRGLPNTEDNRREIRLAAEAAQGLIAGGQQGYKLVTQMTSDEYNHYRNWMKSQADKMTRRILLSDKVFFKRQPIQTGNGILEVPAPETK